jgi:hypothetical protein
VGRDYLVLSGLVPDMFRPLSQKKKKEKSSGLPLRKKRICYSPNIPCVLDSGKNLLFLPNFHESLFFSFNIKTRQTTSFNFLNRDKPPLLTFSNHAFYLSGAVLEAVLLQQMMVLLQ